jgi:hypothetical protein
MILRSLPITDFSPVEGELITLLVLVGVVVRGPSGCGPVDELRWNMEIPKVQVVRPPPTIMARETTEGQPDASAAE